MKAKIAALVLTLGALAITTSIAVGTGGSRGSLASPAAEPASQTISEAFPTFGEEPSGSDDISELHALQHSFTDPSSSNPAGRADFEHARVVPIAGGDKPAWIAPADDRVCVFIPDPVDGYGAGCLTLQNIRDGHGFSFLGGSHKSYVVALVPKGDPSPTVTSESDPSARMETTGNASAGLLPSDAVIRTANATIDLAKGAGPIEHPAE